MAGSVGKTVGSAVGLALGGAILTFGATYFTTVNAVEDDCGASQPPATQDCEPGRDTKEKKARNTAAAAGITYLIVRGGFEGGRDGYRQSSGSVNDADVQQ
jgi:hypothetical protein